MHAKKFCARAYPCLQLVHSDSTSVPAASNDMVTVWLYVWCTDGTTIWIV
jgi:hypothetical protein